MHLKSIKTSILHLAKTLVFFTMILLFAFSCSPNNDDIQYTSISGIWECEEVNQTSDIIRFNTDIDKVVLYDNAFIISNFHNLGEDVFIRVSAIDNELQIPDQSVSNLVVWGSGVISPDFRTIEANYTIDSGNGRDVYEVFFKR